MKPKKSRTIQDYDYGSGEISHAIQKQNAEATEKFISKEVKDQINNCLKKQDDAQ